MSKKKLDRNVQNKMDRNHKMDRNVQNKMDPKNAFGMSLERIFKK